MLVVEGMVLRVGTGILVGPGDAAMAGRRMDDWDDFDLRSGAMMACAASADTERV